MEIHCSCEKCNAGLAIIREWGVRDAFQISVDPCEACLSSASAKENEANCIKLCIWCQDVFNGVSDVKPAEYLDTAGQWIHRYKMGGNWHIQNCFASIIRHATSTNTPY